MIKTLALVLSGALALLLIYAATRPDTFRVQRSLAMRAPPEKVQGLISDVKQFNRWNPWLKKEPATQLTYGPVTAGPGAHFAWVGDKTGSGSMTLSEATPGRVAFQLDFLKPFEGHNTADFTLQPGADGLTTVTWSMQGPMPYVSKLMDVLFGMDRMVGPDFEAGLAHLKALAEQP